MKKLFALLLTLVMVLGMIPAAFAAESNIITQVEITGDLPELEVGDAFALPEFRVPEGANYTLETEWGDDVGTAMLPEDVAEDGRVYILRVKIYPKDGYVLGDIYEDSAALVFNGMLFTAETYGDAEEQLGVTFGAGERWTVEKRYSFKTPIDKIELNYDEPAVGGTPPALRLPTGANYEVRDNGTTHWYNEDGTFLAPTDVFETGKAYELMADLEPKAGYEFAPDARVVVNGEVTDHGGNYDERYIYGNYSFKTKIDKVEISYDAPEVGKPLPEVKLPADANYTLEGEYSGWYDEETDQKVTAIEQGKEYYLYVSLLAKDGYTFDHATELFVNGEQDGENNYQDGDSFWCYGYYSMKPKIDKVEITYAAPEAGKALPEFKLPADANYELTADTQWGDEHYNKVTAIEDGKAYWADIYLVPKDGYEFSDDVEVLINGAAPQESWISDADWINVGNRHTFKEPITAIDLPAVLPETLKAGDSVAPKELEVPAGANYTLWLEWMDVDTGNIPGVGAVAPADGIYIGTIYATTKDGYEFAEDLAVTVGGKNVGGLQVNIWYESVSYMQMYTLGDSADMISKIEITAEKPEIGKEPGKVTVTTNVGEVEAEFRWGVSARDDIDDAGEQKKAWAEGDYAWLAGYVTAPDGGVISPDVEVWFNGEKVTLEEYKNCEYYVYDITLYLNLGQLTVEKPASPATGDSFPVAALIVAALVSAAGIVVLTRKQKKA